VAHRRGDTDKVAGDDRQCEAAATGNPCCGATTVKLSTVLVSSDANPLYIDFFPLVHDVWARLVGVRCILALVADEVPSALAGMKEDIMRFAPIDGVSDGLQSQCIRLLAPQLMGGSDAVLISDIDMLPMNRRYFVDSVVGVPDTSFVVYRSNALADHPDQVAMCYNAAAPVTWAKLVGHRVGTIAEAQDVVKQWAAGVDYDGTSERPGWATDQVLLRRFVDSAGGDLDVVKLTDRQIGFRRLDRSGMRNRANALQMALARRHEYSDYHMLRPMTVHAGANHEIAKTVLEGRPRPADPFRPLLVSSWARRVYAGLNRRLPGLFP